MKVNITTESGILKISITTKRQIKLTILIFFTNLAREGIFLYKNENVNTAFQYRIFKFVYVTNLNLYIRILMFWTKKGYLEGYLEYNKEKVNTNIELNIFQVV